MPPEGLHEVSDIPPLSFQRVRYIYGIVCRFRIHAGVYIYTMCTEIVRCFRISGLVNEIFSIVVYNFNNTGCSIAET